MSSHKETWLQRLAIKALTLYVVILCAISASRAPVEDTFVDEEE